MTPPRVHIIAAGCSGSAFKRCTSRLTLASCLLGLLATQAPALTPTTTTVTYANGETNSNTYFTNTPGSDLILTIPSGAAVQNGTISGNGPVTKTGNGSLSLTAANTYTGGTIISAGTLSIGSGGTTGSIPGNIVNNATLAFRRSDDFTFSGTVSGSGSVSFNGNILRLTSPQTYTGATSIASGYLVLPPSAPQGLSPSTSLNISAGASLDLSNAPLTVAALNGAGTIYSAGGTSGRLTINTAAGSTSSFSGVLGGGFLTFPFPAFSLVKSGPGTLTLSGTNLYTGGTTIESGTLQVGEGGTSGSIIGNITNNSTLTFSRSNDSVMSGIISGSGSLIKSGDGTLTLSGTNSYTGSTTIESGTLSISTPAALANSPLAIEEATLHLNFVGTVTVKSLTMYGSPMRRGTWSAMEGNGTFTSTLITGPGTLIVTEGPASFSNFIASHFSPAEILAAVITTQGADPDQDGIPNIMEYAFELNPRSPSRSPVTSSTSNGHLSLTFPLRTDEGPEGFRLAYTTQVSTDLLNWSSGSEFTETVSTLPVPGAERSLVTVRDLTPIHSAPRRFIRLHFRLDD